MNELTCLTCRGIIPVVEGDRRKQRTTYCSDACLKAGRYEPEPPTDLAPGDVGALGELVVSADLMRRGYAVFRALSPSCPCDLIAMKDDKLLRVEVTKGRRYLKGGCHFIPHDGTIQYAPQIA